MPRGLLHRRLRYTVRVILRDPLAFFSVLVIGLLVVLALLGPWIAPYPEQGKGRTDVPNRFLPPSHEHWLGTDQLGRDVLSRIIIGSRIALQAPAMVVIMAVAVGAPLGALAGYVGGWVDNLIMRVTDLFLAFPSLLLAVTIVAAVGPSLTNAMIAIAISWWPWYTRLVRGVTLSLRERYFVEAARSIGVPSWTIILRHILPNCVTPILVQATIDFGTVILAEGSLAFLGLGTQPPAPDWGLMVSQGRSHILNQWWISTLPGLAIFVSVLAFNLLGDTLRDILDPRQYR
ncbi:MAG TPA: ABC transporter permease [Anaerolineae bacterium]|nr:ABC transporter permease [Anaerolineae bacterium]